MNPVYFAGCKLNELTGGMMGLFNPFSSNRNVFGGVAFGLIMFLLSFPVLIMNEGNSVKNIRALKEMGKTAISVNPVDADASQSGRLIHFTGMALTDTVLRDELFEVHQKAFQLIRSVEMYQWHEETYEESRKKEGGGEEKITRYRYALKWSSELQDSSIFHTPEGHENPEMLIHSERKAADSAGIGVFVITKEQLMKIGTEEVLRVENIPEKTILPGDRKVASIDGGFYIGDNPAKPDVGDYRISFAYVAPEQRISVIALQQNEKLAPFVATNRKKKFLIKNGEHSLESMIDDALSSNTFMTWFVRIAGFFMIFGGLQLIFRPLVASGRIIPVFGSLLSAGLGLVSFLVSVLLSSVVIGIAWFLYRPIISILLFAAAAASLFFLVMMRNKGVAVH